MRGRVRGGHIELDAALPEGAEGVVLTADAAEPFDLDEAQITELEARMAEADRGEVDSAEEHRQPAKQSALCFGEYRV